MMLIRIALLGLKTCPAPGTSIGEYVWSGVGVSFSLVLNGALLPRFAPAGAA